MKIRASNLVLSQDKRKILNIPFFEIESGKIHILLGPNGAGKSSLMRALLGLVENINGNIEIDNININSISRIKRAQEIGYLAQNVKIEWNMNVHDLISLGRLPYGFAGIYKSIDDEKAINEAINMLEINYLLERKIKEISGGELALCLLARVFAGSPKFILIDEPLNHLDIAHQMQLSKALRKFADKGGGILAIVHDLNHALNIGDKFTLLKQGEIVANGDADVVFSTYNLKEAFGIDAQVIDLKGKKFINILHEIQDDLQ